MKIVISAILVLFAASTPCSAQRRLVPPWYFGVEGGLGQFDNTKLNVPSGTVSFGVPLDHRGLLRIAVTIHGMAIQRGEVGGGVSLDFRPLSPRRFTVLLTVGAGVLDRIAPEGDGERYGFIGAGVALRVVSQLTLTLKGTHGDALSNPGPHTIHLGLEIAPKWR
ncbi:MAG: hypothetical protein HOP28_10810 [Gemmatimonadales bacterium]|nr:hypothetical protein [Gemmatimonadales bacterium]